VKVNQVKVYVKVNNAIVVVVVKAKAGCESRSIMVDCKCEGESGKGVRQGE
jgi:hypothetical protein